MKNKLRLGEGIEPCCRLCVHSAEADGDTCLCTKKGIVSAGGKCHRYEYDPLKRVPSPRRKLEERDAEEFSL